MVLDPAKLLGSDPIVVKQSLSKRDTMLYALGVGATELDYVFEDDLKALPTMAAILGYPGFFWRDPKYGVDWKRLLHGEQSITLHSSLPVEGEITGETVIEAVYDKGAGKGAIASSLRKIRGADGDLLATVRMTSFLRGDGGFGGSSDEAPRPHPIPEGRKADATVEAATTPHQALIYRLSGDYNPLHIDPRIAQQAGFDRPILHGLCTYGVVGRVLLSTLCRSDPARFKRMDVRFSSPVYPGEALVTEIWNEGPGKAAFRTSVPQRGVTVLNNGYLEFE